ncbi:hypothetical protein IPV08_15960 [Methylobacterium sp. SD274]|uniref:hypothetical protein n=1 Tax=Methylobacterium sp. SD274 TaxID=2782009 RepID=UPI001A966940|nr:hypothetical protein [Methylobacterium sp. SD274]MBO1021456.1 hypothetical protein [Methylobacterium sp. SD274]
MPYPADIPGSQRVFLSDPATGLPYGASNPIPTGSAAAAGSTPLTYRQVTDVSTSTALPNIPGDATVATVIPDGAGVRMRKDGTAPTTAVGMPIPVGGGVKLYGAEISAARFIQQSAGAILNVEYSK